MKKYQVKINGEIIEIVQDNDGKFIIPEKFRTKGRFPANVILSCECDEVIEKDGVKIHTNPDCPCYMLDQQSGIRNKTKGEYQSPHGIYGVYNNTTLSETYGDKGGASRFFYCAKASRSERNIGLEDMPKKEVVRQGLAGEHKNPLHQNYHPTVKPLALMEYLVKLTSMPNPDQIYLDPFIGSGTTAIACKKFGKKWIGIEKEEKYCEIAKRRIKAILEPLF